MKPGKVVDSFGMAAAWEKYASEGPLCRLFSRADPTVHLEQVEMACREAEREPVNPIPAQQPLDIGPELVTRNSTDEYRVDKDLDHKIFARTGLVAAPAPHLPNIHMVDVSHQIADCTRPVIEAARLERLADIRIAEFGTEIAGPDVKQQCQIELFPSGTWWQLRPKIGTDRQHIGCPPTQIGEICPTAVRTPYSLAADQWLQYFPVEFRGIQCARENIGDLSAGKLADHHLAFGVTPVQDVIKLRDSLIVSDVVGQLLARLIRRLTVRSAGLRCGSHIHLPISPCFPQARAIPLPPLWIAAPAGSLTRISRSVTSRTVCCAPCGANCHRVQTMAKNRIGRKIAAPGLTRNRGDALA